MNWKTATGKTQKLEELESTHLLAIIRRTRDRTIAYWRSHNLIPQAEDLEDDVEELIGAIEAILSERKVSIPSELDLRKIAHFVENGTQDLAFSPLKPKQFDPQTPKLKKEVQRLKEERKPILPRRRTLVDYPDTKFTP